MQLFEKNRYLKILLGAAILLPASGAASWEAPANPKILGKKSMGPSDLTTGHSLKKTPKKVSKKRVRISLELEPYEKFALIERDGKRRTAYKPQKKIGQMLRAKLDQPNHFYVKGYHIETIPMSWDKKYNRYRTKLNFYRTYGQVEETVGSLVVSGELKGKNGLYVLYGNAKKSFRNKSGHIVLKASVGVPVVTDRNISRKPVQKKRRAQMNRKKIPQKRKG